MDYLQYGEYGLIASNFGSFKPYYKWITFNTNTIKTLLRAIAGGCFKPYYKWITFNTIASLKAQVAEKLSLVLNLIINGLPSILENEIEINKLNVNGFKPYYKWITFNT